MVKKQPSAPTKVPYIISVIGLVIVTIIFWFIYTASPFYTLHQIQNAYENKDVQLASQYIDIDAIADQVAQAAFEKVQTQVASPIVPVNTSKEFEAAFGDQITLALLPAYKQKMKANFEDLFTRAILGKRSDLRTPLFLDVSTIDALMDKEGVLESNGENYTLYVPTPMEFTYEFGMEQVGTTWVIVRIENVDELLNHIDISPPRDIPTTPPAIELQ